MWSFAGQRAATIAGATTGVFAHIFAQAQQRGKRNAATSAHHLTRVRYLLFFKYKFAPRFLFVLKVSLNITSILPIAFSPCTVSFLTTSPGKARHSTRTASRSSHIFWALSAQQYIPIRAMMTHICYPSKPVCVLCAVVKEMSMDMGVSSEKGRRTIKKKKKVSKKYFSVWAIRLKLLQNI